MIRLKRSWKESAAFMLWFGKILLITKEYWVNFLSWEKLNVRLYRNWLDWGGGRSKYIVFLRLFQGAPQTTFIVPQTFFFFCAQFILMLPAAPWLDLSTVPYLGCGWGWGGGRYHPFCKPLVYTHSWGNQK